MENSLLLQINNISVVYSDVIQILKAVSLDVKKRSDCLPAREQRCGQDDYPKGDFRAPEAGERQGYRGHDKLWRPGYPEFSPRGGHQVGHHSGHGRKATVQVPYRPRKSEGRNCHEVGQALQGGPRNGPPLFRSPCCEKTYPCRIL